jgi:hypothetical protein
MKSILLFVLLALLALLPSLSIAGATYGNANPPLIIASEQLLPHRGGYWDPAAPGSGYFVDIMRRADSSVFGFSTIYTYDNEGRSTFMIMQGAVEFASETQRQTEGWYAKLVSGTFTVANGQPFGGAWRYPDFAPSTFGEGELVWKTRRTAELRVGGRVTQIRTLSAEDPTNEAISMLAGEWTVQVRQRALSAPGVFFHPAGQQYHSHVVRLTPVTPAPVWTQGYGAATIPQAALAKIWLPPANVITFDVVCVSECLPANPPYPQFIAPTAMTYHGARVWIDPVTLRAGWVHNAVATTSQAATPNVTQGEVGSHFSVSYDLYVDDDTAVGRGTLLWTNRSSSYPAGLYPGSELVMTRVTVGGLRAPTGQEVKIY